MTASEDGPSRDSASRRRRRRRVLGACAAAVALVIIAGTWAVATAFESPAQRDAAATPPKPGPVLAAVTQGDLSRTVRSSATVVRAHRQSLGLGATEGAAVVTASDHAQGAELVQGSVIVAINGRPRFATQGSFPYYRDLAPGDTGPDVTQLQESLGIPADGVFGARTVAAVAALYRKAGFDAPVEDPPSTPSVPEQGAAATPDEAAQPARAAPTMIVPASDLVVLRALPSYVISVPDVGELDDDASLEVESGDLVVRATLPSSVADELTESMPVSISKADTTIAGRALARPVEPVGRDEATEEFSGSGDGPRTRTTESQSDFVAADGALDPSWRGSRVTVGIVVVIAAEDSLLVPSIAVVTGKGGSATVRRLHADGSFRSVPVVEQATLDGRSALTVVEPGALTAGDQVRVD